MGALGSGPETAGARQVVRRTVKGEFQEEVMLELRRQHRHDRQFPAGLGNQTPSSTTLPQLFR